MLTPLLLALCAPTPEVLDVDAAQGPYFEIRDAIADAVDGDVVRVAPGQYGWFGVFGKSITVVAATPTRPTVTGSVRIQNTVHPQRVVLSGFRIEREVQGDDPLIIAGNAGAIRIEDCHVDGVSEKAVRIDLSLDVTFDSCSIVAGAWFDSFNNGFHSAEALYTELSNITAWHSSFLGSDASVYSVDGGHGIFSRYSHVFLHGSSAQGGDGGPEDIDTFGGHCHRPGAGGHGVRIVNGGMRLLDSALNGGQPGQALSCDPSPPGDPYSADTHSTVEEFMGGGLALTCDALTLDGIPYDVSASGEPGDTILLVVGPDTGLVGLPAYTGDLHVGGPVGAARRVPMGTGSAQLTLQLPDLPSLTTAQMFLQTVHLRAGEVVFGPTRSLTIVDAAW